MTNLDTIGEEATMYRLRPQETSESTSESTSNEGVASESYRRVAFPAAFPKLFRGLLFANPSVGMAAEN